MNLRLYAAGCGWLVLPECMLDSRTTFEKFGSVEFRGIVDQWLSEGEVAEILMGFELDSYAQVTDALGRRLLRAIEGNRAASMRQLPVYSGKQKAPHCCEA